MGFSDSISRLTEYYSRHGFAATFRRAGLAARRKFFANRMVVFYCDLGKLTSPPVKIPKSLRVERLRSEAELSPHDLLDLTSFWNPELARRNIKERFTKGASLWLVRAGDQVAGYGWTLHGSTIEPYYFPLGQGDVHLFDFHVFPQYRGQGMNPFLVTQILQNLAANGGARAFIEAAEWNVAQLGSLRKTQFCRLGLVRTFRFFGLTFVSWAGHEIVEQVPKSTEQGGRALTPARPHE